MPHILQHKSWHIWNRDVIEKIDRDEKLDKEDQDKKKRRLEEIEHEQRISQLKERTHQTKKTKLETPSFIEEDIIPGGAAPEEEEVHHNKPEQKKKKSVKQPPPLKHINFFEAEERSEKQSGLSLADVGTGNEEYQKEKKAKDDKFTKYLGEGSAETSTVKPWYWDNTTANKSVTPTDQIKIERRKEAADPLGSMKHYLDQTKKHHEKKEDLDNKEKKKKDIEHLRQERMKRELQEREKIAALVNQQSDSNAQSGSRDSKNSNFREQRSDSNNFRGQRNEFRGQRNDSSDFRGQRNDSRDFRGERNDFRGRRDFGNSRYRGSSNSDGQYGRRPPSTFQNSSYEGGSKLRDDY